MLIQANRTVRFIIGFCFLFSFQGWTQDVHFSQYRETPLLVNPAQTALLKDFRVIMNYKDQWRSFVSPYKTFAFSAELKTTKDKKRNNYLGVGIQLYSDKAGDSQMGTMLGSFNISGVLKVSEFSSLSAGIMAGYGQRSVNYSNLKWESQYIGNSYDPNVLSGEMQGKIAFGYPDAGAGFAWAYGKDPQYILANNGVHAILGISAFHMGIPDYSFYNISEKLNSKFVSHGNVDVGIKNSNLIAGAGFLFSNQAKQQEIIVGGNLKYILQEESKYTLIKKGAALSLGIDYRIKDALITSLLYEFYKYSFGISYDINVSNLKSASYSRGGLEIAIRFTTPNPFSNTASVRFL